MDENIANVGAFETGPLEKAVAYFQTGDFDEAVTLASAVQSDAALDGEVRAAAKRFVETVASHVSQRTPVPDQACEDYVRWYYRNLVWTTTHYSGVPILKSPCDLWNYQEIIADLKPRLIVEFGTYSGASARFFADILRNNRIDGRVFTVDADFSHLHSSIKDDPLIETLCSSSSDPQVAARITQLRQRFDGPLFAILDSDHRMQHVLAELELLRPLLTSRDYLVVEDGCINGHPLLPNWGPGPFEAIETYFSLHPDDYERDRGRENKFGFTFAVNGFLRRR